MRITLHQAVAAADGEGGHDVAYGLDTEWAEDRSVALVQVAIPAHGLATVSAARGARGGDVVLVRMSEVGDRLPASLAALLASQSLFAVGVGVGQDLRLVRRQWPSAAQEGGRRGCGWRFLELPALAAARGVHHDGARGGALGLRSLCRLVLDRDLPKDRCARAEGINPSGSERRSRWGARACPESEYSTRFSWSHALFITPHLATGMEG